MYQTAVEAKPVTLGVKLVECVENDKECELFHLPSASLRATRIKYFEPHEVKKSATVRCKYSERNSLSEQCRHPSRYAG